MPRRAVLGVLLLGLLGLAACSFWDDGPQTCLRAVDCGAREYCARPIGACESPGTCRGRPQICLQLYSPVCSCENKDYGNACKAAAYGASVGRADVCPAD